MPVVFTQKLVDERYGDSLGKEYRFPIKYRDLLKMLVGDRFTYYRPAEGSEGRCYLGIGTIIALDVDQKNSEICIARLGQYQPFRRPVHYKLPNGHYAETGDKAQPMFWWSVRNINEADIKRIESLALN